MTRNITVAAVQTGPVLTDDLSAAVAPACAMIDEASRALALQGAEIAFMPICAATYGEQKLRANTWELPIQAGACENGVFVVAPNRAGDENGCRHSDKSMIVNPVGAEIMCLSGTDEPEVLVATLDLDDAQVAQKSLPWWRDWRPDLCAALTAH